MYKRKRLPPKITPVVGRRVGWPYLLNTDRIAEIFRDTKNEEILKEIE